MGQSADRGHGLSHDRQRIEDVRRVHDALGEVAAFLRRGDGCEIEGREYKNNRPTTSLDRKLDCLLRKVLVCPNEGWLSEESPDDLRRLGHERVWIVDPLDGTAEFIQGLPEWTVSIGLVEHGQAVAGGVLNPSTGEILVGSVETGLVTVKVKRAAASGAVVLVSRREHAEGKWRRLETAPLIFVPMGSIAYRLALVAAGEASATCTLEPRCEWDIAGGIALVRAAGGEVRCAKTDIKLNQSIPRLDSVFAFSRRCEAPVRAFVLGGQA